MNKEEYGKLFKSFASFLRFIYRVHVHGLENEPDGGKLLLCSNHICLADPICICVTLRKNQPYFMAKKELFKVPIVRRVIRIFNAYPVNRGASDLGAVHKTIDILNEGNCVGMFPQGTRCKGLDVSETEFKTGAALIASKSECPVLPIRISMKNNRWRPFRRIDVYIGKVITPDEIKQNTLDTRGAELKRITNLIFDRVCALGTESDKA